MVRAEKGDAMRMLIIIAVAVCWLCVRFNECGQLLRAGSDGKPVYTQPPITQAEYNAAQAERRERIRREGLPHASPEVRRAIMMQLDGAAAT
jgi:hypothetical protein